MSEFAVYKGVAGSKPWGGGQVVHTFKTKETSLRDKKKFNERRFAGW